MHLTHRLPRPSLPEDPIMPTITTAPSVLIRAARGSDGPGVARIAALDSAPVPTGELLVAEADGALVAVRSLSTGAAVADPFRPSADVLELLDLRARALTARTPRRSLTDRLGLRAGRVASRTA
jgi:hypothetical protein